MGRVIALRGVVRVGHCDYQTKGGGMKGRREQEIESRRSSNYEYGSRIWKPDIHK
jgi:hypothetical protein